MYMTLITESYWKQNYKNFKQKNPYLTNYLKEDFKRNGYNSKLLLETMMLNESSKLDEYQQIMNNLATYTAKGDMEGIRHSVDKLNKLVPNSVKNTPVPKERVVDLYDTIKNTNTESLDAPKETKSFIKRLGDAFKFVIDYNGIDVITVTVIVILLYILGEYIHYNRYDIKNAREKLIVLAVAIIAGSIYIVVKSFIKQSEMTKKLLNNLKVDYK